MYSLMWAALELKVGLLRCATVSGDAPVRHAWEEVAFLLVLDLYTRQPRRLALGRYAARRTLNPHFEARKTLLRALCFLRKSPRSCSLTPAA